MKKKNQKKRKTKIFKIASNLHHDFQDQKKTYEKN